MRVWTIAMWATCLFGGYASAATLQVTTTDDGGPGSLRQAVADAAPGDTIVINVSGTITLIGGALVVNKDLTIAGPGAAALVIDARRASRVFEIGSPGTPVAVTITGLTLTNGAAASGGGILNDGTLTLRDATLTAHAAVNEGGGIFNRGTLYLTDANVTGNTAMVGGGIGNRDGIVSIVRSTIASNTADSSFGGIGGGIASQAGGFFGAPVQETLTIRDTVMSNNTASLRGGAIYNATGLLTIVNSTIAANASTYVGAMGPCLCPGGGGVYNAMGTARITGSTLAGNSASTAGGAITSLHGVTTLKTTVLAKGVSGPNCHVGPSGAIKSDGYNLSDDPSCSGALTGAGDRNGVPAELNPMGLEANGGATRTIQLLPSSPAIDAVPADECEALDQRGETRPQGSACDIGAYERPASPYAADIQMPIKVDGSAVFNANRGVVPVKFALRLHGAGTCELPPATISLARRAGESIGPISDAAYDLPADAGNEFRVDAAPCQYAYNLAIASLGSGSYWASISIDGVVVGTATFGIR
jgi:predicted outer membrane repeat protein